MVEIKDNWKRLNIEPRHKFWNLFRERVLLHPKMQYEETGGKDIFGYFNLKNIPNPPKLAFLIQFQSEEQSSFEVFQILEEK